MRGNEFLDKMELIDPAYVEVADAKPKGRKIAWVKWGAVAACFCLVVASALMIPRIWNTPVPPPNSDPITSDTAKLKPITIPELSVGGMGFEGYMYHDISELNNGNPWDESMSISSLPVYKNGAYDSSGAGFPKGMSEAEMMAKLNFIVYALDLEIVSTEVIAGGFIVKDGKTVPDTTPTEIHAKTDNGIIYVQADGNITYFLSDEGLDLPDNYNFTYSKTTDDEAKDILSYFIDAYDDLLNFKKPNAVSSGDYNIYGEFNRSYIVYDTAGDDLESILNYNFCSVKFSPNDYGNLSAISINDGLFLAEKIGDYPIVAAEKATERLISGNYQTSVPVEFPGKEFIGKIELVYRAGRFEEVLLPYYRFYVQLPDTVNQSAAEKGLKTYGGYYVPAIEDEYITNMPLYDGSFN